MVREPVANRTMGQTDAAFVNIYEFTWTLDEIKRKRFVDDSRKGENLEQRDDKSETTRWAIPVRRRLSARRGAAHAIKLARGRREKERGGRGRRPRFA